MTTTTAASVEAFLRANRFQQHGKTWRGNTPGKPGSDSQACVVTIEGPENGAYINFTTGESGSLYAFADKYGISKAEPVAIATTKRAYTGLAEYAAAHGADAETFTKARWVETTYAGRPALAFDTETGTRYRFLDGQKPPYMSPSGYDACWYGLKRAADMALKADLPLVLVNGEASTVVCHRWGIPAACVTSGGERALPPALLQTLRAAWTGRIVIAFDCDMTGRENAVKLRDQLTDYAVAVVDFGLGSGGDAADWCALYRETALSELLKRATFSTKAPTQADTPKYVRSGALMKQVASFYRKVQTGDAALTLSTGIEAWDRALLGGMWSGLNFIAGPMGSGKSTLASSVVGNWTRMGKRGAIYTTEMTPGQWVTRTWAHLAGVRTDEIMMGSYNRAFAEAVATAEETLGSVDHIWQVEGTPTVAGIRDDLLRMVANDEIGFVVIDSSSNMRADGVSGSIFDQTKAVTNQLASLSKEAQAIVGDTRPIPFLVTHQANANNLLKRADKSGTMLDSYGGQSPSQDATTYTVINYLTWFVARNLADPDPNYPEGVAALIVDKHRFFMNSSDKPVRVRYEPGMGFYGDRVPAAGALPKPRVLPPVRKDIDGDDDDEAALAILYPNTGTEPVTNVPF